MNGRMLLAGVVVCCTVCAAEQDIEVIGEEPAEVVGPLETGRPAQSPAAGAPQDSGTRKKSGLYYEGGDNRQESAGDGSHDIEIIEDEAPAQDETDAASVDHAIEIIDDDASVLTAAGAPADDAWKEPPSRPIAQTAVGIGLTVAGGVTTLLNVIDLLMNDFIDTGADEDYYDSGPSLEENVVLLAPGLGMLIPGIIFINISRQKWAVYHEWQRGSRESSGARFGMSCAFTF